VSVELLDSLVSRSESVVQEFLFLIRGLVAV
jgi:hypothetical protein